MREERACRLAGRRASFSAGGGQSRARYPCRESVMSQAERVEVLVLGSGAGGKHLAWHMGKAGHRTARRRAQVDRRLVPEHQLPAEQERGLERRRWPTSSAMPRPSDGRDGRPHGHGRRCCARKREMVEGLVADAPRAVPGERRRADHGRRRASSRRRRSK